MSTAMELTAKTLHEVTFGAKVRGYDPTEVDDFIAAVAEGVEELQERLRRAVERANRAEQQLESAQSAPPAAEPMPPSQTVEIGKVWERAAAAAEAAVEEAKADAHQLLENARQQADAQLEDAQRQADATVNSARDEAASIAHDAQAQLRAEITQLETARDQLKFDVEMLSTYIDEERERVRDSLSRALGALEEGTPARPPQVDAIDIPPAPEVTQREFRSYPGSGSQHFAPEPEAQPVSHQDESDNAAYGNQSKDDENAYGDQGYAAHAGYGEHVSPEAGGDSDDYSQQQGGYSNEGYGGYGQQESYGEQQQQGYAAEWQQGAEGWGQSGEVEQAQQSWGAAHWGQDDAQSADADTQYQASEQQGWFTEQQPSHEGWGQQEQSGWGEPQHQPEQSQGQEQEESDPFLAELRRAVQDDGPLGPREEGEGDDGSIDSLYASDEDNDRSGFFRRKK
jgi:DivIVA domain-containing protein